MPDIAAVAPSWTWCDELVFESHEAICAPRYVARPVQRYEYTGLLLGSELYTWMTQPVQGFTCQFLATSSD